MVGTLKNLFTKIIHFFLIFFIINCFFAFSNSAIKVYFSPEKSDAPHSPYFAFKEFIQKAEKSLYIAAYNFNLKEIADLLVRKKQAGVYVELFLEKKNYTKLENQGALKALEDGGIKIIQDSNYALMHNKYVIRDEKSILTGSLNFTQNGFFHNYNDLVIIHNADLAEVYLKDYIFLSSQFHLKKYRKNYQSRPREIALNEKENVLPFFSLGRNKPEDFFREMIKKSKKKINFLIFSFSSKEVSNYLIEALKRGIAIKGIFDDSFESINITRNWQQIPFQILWKNQADVYYDKHWHAMHHKLMLIDKNKIITGSFNFSNNAFKRNNENLLIITSSFLHDIYQKRFNTIWKKYNRKTDFEEYIILKNQGKTALNYRAYLIKKKLKEKKQLPQVGEKFSGEVIKVISAKEVIIRLTKNQKNLRFELSGLAIPQQGIPVYHQEPQFSLTKEVLTLLAVRKKVTGKVFQKGKNIFYGSLSLAGKQDQKTLNEIMLLQGTASLLADDKKVINNHSPRLWQKMEKAVKEAKKAKKMLWGEYALDEAPEKFQKKLEKILIQMALKEKQFSEASYQRGYIIGNRKTKKAYYSYESTYFEYLKDLEDKKLIFFKDEKNALKAGYELKN